MWRRVLTSVVAVMVAGAVLWGGCVACQQVFPANKAASGCCNPAGKCQAPAQKEQGHQHCKSQAQAAEQFVKAEAAWTVNWSLPVVEVPTVVMAVAPVPAPSPTWSPPEIFLLDSSFRI